MIGYDVNGGASSFKVVTPMFEGVVDGHDFFVMNIVISLDIFKHPRVKSHWVVVAIRGSDGQHCH